MFEVMMIPNPERFVHVVEHSRGSVVLHFPDNTQCDLKQDRAALQLFKILKPGQGGIRISLTDPSDCASFMQYMMEARIETQ